MPWFVGSSRPFVAMLWFPRPADLAWAQRAKLASCFKQKVQGEKSRLKSVDALAWPWGLANRDRSK